MSRTLQLFVGLAVISSGVLAQASLQITTPADHTVVRPGETFVIFVTPSGGPFAGVFIAAPDLLGGGVVLKNPPYQFSATVPAAARPGLSKLTAAGSTDSGTPIQSDPIFVDIERPDSPTRLSVDVPPQMEIQVGHVLSVHLGGKYSDGKTFDLSRSTQTKYEIVPPGPASVDREGFVTGVAIGRANLVIRHRERQMIVSVVVTRDP
jgi:hypothetical protein